MNKYMAVPIALGVSVSLVMGEGLGEGKPHAEFLAVSPGLSANIASSNVAATTIYSTSNGPANFVPLERKIPCDRLVTETAGLVLPFGLAV
jgi:hypothetical protein